MASSSSSSSSSSSAASAAPKKALYRGAAWVLPGVAEVTIHVQDASGNWIDTRDNPPIVTTGKYGFSNTVQRNLPIKALGQVVTLGAGERYRFHIAPLQGATLCAKITVDTAPLYSSGCAVVVEPQGTAFEGFRDQALGTLQPFQLKEIEIVEGSSLRAFTAGQDAMAKAGRIDISLYTAVPAAAGRQFTSAVAGSATSLLTSEKKALLNGLGTSAPTFASGSVTYDSAPFDVGTLLGSIQIKYRDRSAVLLWLGMEAEADAEEASAAGGGGGGGGGAKKQKN